MSQSNVVQIPTAWNRLSAAAANIEKRIADIHHERPCPKCGAPIGERCYMMRWVGTGPTFGVTPHTKHPHQERIPRELLR